MMILEHMDVTCSDRQYLPFPHNGPRSSCMDTGCWEVKWRHRDDCVSALMVGALVASRGISVIFFRVRPSDVSPT